MNKELKMKGINILWLVMIVFFSCNKADKKNLNTDMYHGIIPAPNFMQIDTQEVSSITEVKVFIPENHKSDYFTSLLSIENKSSIASDEKSANTIVKIDTSLAEDSYQLNVEKDKINILASDKASLQYAIVSLSQMISLGGFPLPIAEIKDSPKFKYRGMHLDVARHFFGVDDVKKYLDYMAYYKFNQFHWHLTEDQGWRIEIKKYPKLQEIAAFRKETLIGHYSDQPHQFDGQKYGGFYTQEEVKEIVSYATDRNINVIPEIEMPGHAQAALAAYPELGCGKGPYEVATKWGVFEDVFCPTENTFKFLEDVIDEVITLFPGKYIHIGGDECPKTAWEKSDFCQKLMKEKGIKDEHGLQSYFITRMEKYINGKGKQIIGWDEILEGGLAPNATVMSWRGIEGGLEAARSDHDVVMTPGTHCYFDHYQSEAADEPLAIGGYTDVEKVYDWNPIPEELEDDKKKYILGGQANLWSEYLPKFSDVEYMAFSRGMAMAEALWSDKKDYPDFIERFDKHVPFWQTKGANMAYHVFELKPKIKPGEGGPISLTFDLPEGVEITYNVNGQNESMAMPGEIIKITESGVYKFTAKKGKNKGKDLNINFDLHKATNASIKLDSMPSKQYHGKGPGSIINGVLGSDQKYGGSEWLGFEGDDASGVLDFGKEIAIKSVDFRFFKGEGQWIYLPSKVTVFTSDNGVDFNQIAVNDKIATDSKIANVQVLLKDLKSRYLRFQVTNYGLIPAGAQGAGHPSWLFIDEVVVK
jgi:hexosaminidase